MGEIIIAMWKIEFRVFGYGKELPIYYILSETTLCYIYIYINIYHLKKKRKKGRALLSHFHRRLCARVSIQ